MNGQKSVTSFFSNLYWTLTGSIYKKTATLKRQSAYLTFEGRFKIAFSA